MYSIRCIHSIRSSFLSRNLNHVRYASSLVLGDFENGQLTKNTTSALSAASRFGDLSLLICNSQLNEDVCKTVAKDIGVKEVFYSNSSDQSTLLPENYCSFLQELQTKYHFDYIIGCSTIASKTVLSRFAAKQNTLMVTDIVNILKDTTFQRYVYAGNALETVQVSSSPIVLTVRPSKHFSTDLQKTSNPVITQVNIPVDPRYSTFQEEHKTKSERFDLCILITNRPELVQAERVVVGGRGVGKKDQFKVIFDLADKLHAAVGGTRAVVDQEMIEASLQVGQTGKTIAPSLYIGCGVSGSIQHQAGMKDSQTIVCINKDPEAPLFNIADFGIVGDLHEVVPELTSKL